MRSKRIDMLAVGIGLGAVLALALYHPPAAEAERLAAPMAIRGPVVWDGQAATPSHPPIDGFVLRQQAQSIEDTPAGQAMAQIEAGQWVRAIQTIESIPDDPGACILDERGMVRPLHRLKRSLILSLPTEGRRVFRKLNGPSARTKLAQARAISALDRRAQAYAELVEQYPLCDAAGEAGVALGDLRFEQGRFDDAAAAYRFAAEHPAAIDRGAALLARRLVALSRAERWQAFDALAEDARFRHADNAVILAGESLTINHLIDRLLSDRPRPDTDRPRHAGQKSAALPATDTPAYTRTLIDDDLRQALRIAARNVELNNVIDRMLAPRHAADNNGRLFTLTLGSVARLDPVTGEDLWRVGSIPDNGQALVKQMHRIRTGYPQALTARVDTVLAIVFDDNVARPRLAAFDAETGRIKWHAKQDTRSNTYTQIVGVPLIDGDTVYAAARQPNESTLSLLKLSLDTGQTLASIDLGRTINDPHMTEPAEFSPRLALTPDHLLVQTNQGAAIALRRDDLAFAWAHTEPIRISGFSHARLSGMVPPGSVARHTGNALAHDGLVLIKATRANTVHAIRERDGTLVWSAPTDDDAALIHADDRHAYVLGKQLVALDLHTGEPAWWTPHMGEASGQPAVTDDRLVVSGDRRLCAFDRATGRLQAYRDGIDTPADVRILGSHLIRVTDQRLIAYPLDQPRRD